MLRGLWAGALSGAALAAMPGTAGVWMVAAGAVAGAFVGAALRKEARSAPRTQSEERSRRLAPLLFDWGLDPTVLALGLGPPPSGAPLCDGHLYRLQ
jgi:hypothetical protein